MSKQLTIEGAPAVEYCYNIDEHFIKNEEAPGGWRCKLSFFYELKDTNRGQIIDSNGKDHSVQEVVIYSDVTAEKKTIDECEEWRAGVARAQIAADKEKYTGADQIGDKELAIAEILSDTEVEVKKVKYVKE